MPELAQAAAGGAAFTAAWLLWRELRAIRELQETMHDLRQELRDGMHHPAPMSPLPAFSEPPPSQAAKPPPSPAAKPPLLPRQSGEDVAVNMTAAGIGRMRTVGSILSAMPRVEHNKLVAALSRRYLVTDRSGDS